eukprot:scaffold28338_cov38-Cyclotella_meneghiniana.AAC.5
MSVGLGGLALLPCRRGLLNHRRVERAVRNSISVLNNAHEFIDYFMLVVLGTLEYPAIDFCPFGIWAMLEKSPGFVFREDQGQGTEKAKQNGVCFCVPVDRVHRDGGFNEATPVAESAEERGANLGKVCTLFTAEFLNRSFVSGCFPSTPGRGAVRPDHVDPKLILRSLHVHHRCSRHEGIDVECSGGVIQSRVIDDSHQKIATLVGGLSVARDHVVEMLITLSNAGKGEEQLHLVIYLGNDDSARIFIVPTMGELKLHDGNVLIGELRIGWPSGDGSVDGWDRGGSAATCHSKRC